MDFDIKKHTVLLTVVGSRAYGMALPTSDVDVKGTCIPPKKYRDGFLHRFEQVDKPTHFDDFKSDLNSEEKQIVKATKLEGSIYDIKKFFKLASDCNPNILDVLYCRDQEVRVCSSIGEKLRENRDLFLSTKVRYTFAGYAASQLKRIKLHRSWLLNPPSHPPTRKEFGLPEIPEIPKNQYQAIESMIRKQIDSWEIDFGSMDEASKIYILNQMYKNLAEQKLASDAKFLAAARMLGFNENFIEYVHKEREYYSAKRHWKQYQEWKKNRNPERAKMEAEFHFDLKHASHLVRLIRMCRELLETGKVNVWREDAEELLAIRRGGWTYDELIEYVDQEENEFDRLFKETSLPKRPALKKLDNLCLELIEQFQKEM